MSEHTFPSGWDNEETEYRVCNECGESWVDTGDDICPFCKSEDTEGGHFAGEKDDE